MRQNKITNAPELRAILLAAMEGILEGRVSVPQANAVAALSTELPEEPE